MAKLLKDSTHHNKSRKYAPKGVDLMYISLSMADVEQIVDGLSPDLRARHVRAMVYVEKLQGIPIAPANIAWTEALYQELMWRFDDKEES